MGNICCKRRKRRRKKIVLLLVGLDNAGKTVAAKGLAGEPQNSPVPTIGFSVIELVYDNFEVKIYDLGGGPTIRGIWPKYFVDAHGVIFVIDASDFQRFPEVKFVLQELVYNEKISGKPLLILANKQDQEMALDEIDVIEYLQIESLVNTYKCPTLVQSCSASASKNARGKIDVDIKTGYEWLLNYITRNYDEINARVTADVTEQVANERIELEERIARIKARQAAECKKIEEEDGIQSYDEYAAAAKQLNNGEANRQPATTEKQRVPPLNDVFVVNERDTLRSVSSNNSSSDDNTSFPTVYYGNVRSEINLQRPKSATDVVRNQLRLVTHRDVVIGSSAIVNTSGSNKVAPITLFDVTANDNKRRKKPSSARERPSKDVSGHRRFLKSAGDYKSKVFVVGDFEHVTSVANENYVGPSGDFHREMFQLNNFERIATSTSKSKCQSHIQETIIDVK